MQVRRNHEVPQQRTMPPRSRRRLTQLSRALCIGVGLWAVPVLVANHVQADRKPSSPQSANKGKDWALKDQSQAKQVLATVQTFYNRTKSLEARFKQEYYSKLYKKKTYSKGRVVFKKPGRMRWEYAKPNGKVIVSDGKRLRIYEPGEKTKKGRSPGTLVERKMGAHQLPVAFSFLTGVGKLEEDFKYRLLDPRRAGVKDGYLLELRPKKPRPGLAKMLFVVGSGKTKGVVRRVVMIDPVGNFNSLTFLASSLKFNRGVKDNYFKFSAPAGTSVVEM